MNWKIVNFVRRFIRIGWIKTIYLNFSLLPFKRAIKLPIVATKYTYIYALSGKLEITAPIRFGMIRIGFFRGGCCSSQKQPSIDTTGGQIDMWG